MAPPMAGGGPGKRAAQISGGKPKNISGVVARLFGYIKPDMPLVSIAALCVLVSSATSLAGSYILRPLINNYIVPGGTDKSGLLAGLGVMALIYLAGVFSTYFQSRIMIRVSQNALQKMRNELFEKMQRLPVSFFDRHTRGELMSRYTNDVDTVGELLNNTIVQLISGSITIVGTLAIMIYTNFLLTIVTVVMIPLFAKAGGAIAGKSRSYFRKQQEALGEMNGYIEETVTGQKVVKVFCHEQKSVDEFKKYNESLKEKQIKAQFIGGIMGPVMGNLSQINYALTAAIGGILCIAKSFDVGGLTIFVNFSRHFSRPINELSMQVATLMSALAGAERVFSLMDEKPEENLGTLEELPPLSDSVELKNVTFSYNPEKTILKNISLKAPKGSKTAFVGSTGAGKTTIINLLTRFYDVDSGEILFDGVNITDYKKETLRQNIAMVLQDTHLFSGTIMENIRYGRLDATDEEVIEAAKTSDAHKFIKHLKDGYNTMLEGDGSNLSQGQRQLLNIARAALSKAPILILDEATSSVDTRTEQSINKGMDSLMEDRTTFVIAHRLSTIKNSDLILVLEHGEIIERGTHDELLDMKGRYYELYTGLKELD
ncbi:MAG: ABC transporter ATP-binding protein [Clostridia bacterium]|nr:ABC transporter ATP-binding protein [Clostridia bacterium]